MKLSAWLIGVAIVVALGAAQPAAAIPGGGQLNVTALEDVTDGAATQYGLSVTNDGSLPLSGPIQVDLTYSEAFGVATVDAHGWTCTLGTASGTCTWPDDLPPGSATDIVLFDFTVQPPYGDEVFCDFFRSPCLQLRGEVVGGGTAVGSSAVTVNGNTPPNAVEDFFFFGANPSQPFDADVLSNDLDPNFSYFDVSIVDPQPAHGTASVDPVSHHILYVPDGSGMDDVVRYRLYDGLGGVDTTFAHFGHLTGGIAFDVPLANIGQVEPGRVAMVVGSLANTTGMWLVGAYSLSPLDAAEVPGVLAAAGYDPASPVDFDPTVFEPRDQANFTIPATGGFGSYAARPKTPLGTVWLARLRVSAHPNGSPDALVTAETVMAVRSALPSEVPVHVRDDAFIIPADQATVVHPLANDDSAAGNLLTVSSTSILLFDEPPPNDFCCAVEWTEGTNGQVPFLALRITPNPGFTGTSVFYYAASEVTGPGPGFLNRYDFATINLIVGTPTPPVAVASGSASICAGESAGLTGSGGVSCTWSPTTGLDDATSCAPNASPGSTTTYTLTVRDAFNQQSTNNPTVTVTVNPLPIAVASGSTTIPAGGSAPLTGSGGASCTWSPASGLDNAASCTPIASPTDTTTYALVVTSAEGCGSVNPASATVTVQHAPPIAVASGSATICAGASTPLAGSGGVSCSWLPTTGLDDAASCSPNAGPGSTTTYALTVRDANGQPSTNNPTVTVTVDPLPAAAAGGSTTITQGQSAPLFGAGGVSCAWSPATGLDNAASCTPIATPTTTTTYGLVVRSAPGCASTNPASATIIVIPQPFLPDLVIPAIVAPARADSGETIAISVTTRNAGAIAAGASTTRLYFSVDKIVDSGDTVIGAAAVPALNAGQSSSAAFTFTVPSGLDGKFYVVARADDAGTIPETNEANNVESSKLQVKKVR